eukprot:SM000024S07771  [mRNA]  locus=s24:304026:304750:- [translate_table: standard]
MAMDTDYILVCMFYTLFAGSIRRMHRAFVLFGLWHKLEKELKRPIQEAEVLGLLSTFYNLNNLKADDEDVELGGLDDDFELPSSIVTPAEEGDDAP